MASPDAFRELLEKRGFTEEIHFQEVLAYARENKCSVKTLIRIYEKLIDDDSGELSGVAVRVEDIVRRLVRQWRGQLLRGEANMGNPEHIKEREPSATRCGDLGRLNDVAQTLLAKVDCLTRLFECEREEARDRETRYLNRISELERQLKEQEEKCERELEKLSSLLASPDFGNGQPRNDQGETSTTSRANNRRQSSNKTKRKHTTVLATSGGVSGTCAGHIHESSCADETACSSEDELPGLTAKNNLTSTQKEEVTKKKERKAPAAVSKNSSAISDNTRSTNSQGHSSSLFPSWDTLGEDVNIWELVSRKKPTGKKAVVYIGNLGDNTTEETLGNFVRSRCTHAKLNPPKIFTCTIFSRKDESGKIVQLSARMMVDEPSQKHLCNRGFWFGGIYARPWIFKDRSVSPDVEPQPGSSHTSQCAEQISAAREMSESHPSPAHHATCKHTLPW